MKTSAFASLLLLIRLVADCGAYAASGSATLTPDADTTLFELVPTGNLGGADTLIAGAVNTGARGRPLLRFNLVNSIPANATISQVRLEVRVSKTGALDADYSLHKLLVSWGEGDKVSRTGEAAADGEASWLARSTPNVLWSEPGGEPGGDYLEGASASCFVTGANPMIFTATSALVADVQNWLARPDDNFGWIIICGSEEIPQTSKRLSSREDPGHAPTLTISYTTPDPESGPRLAVTRVQDHLELTFQAGPGLAWILESRGDWANASWQTLTTFPAPDSSRMQSYSLIPDKSTQFFRLRSSP